MWAPIPRRGGCWNRTTGATGRPLAAHCPARIRREGSRRQCKRRPEPTSWTGFRQARRKPRQTSRGSSGQQPEEVDVRELPSALPRGDRDTSALCDHSRRGTRPSRPVAALGSPRRNVEGAGLTGAPLGAMPGRTSRTPPRNPPSTAPMAQLRPSRTLRLVADGRELGQPRLFSPATAAPHDAVRDGKPTGDRRRGEQAQDRTLRHQAAPRTRSTGLRYGARAR